MTSESKANIKDIDSFAFLWQSEIDPTGRVIKFASAEKPALIQIHTDTFMNLRIRLLESPPKSDPKLSPKMLISGSRDWGMCLSQNGTLIRRTDTNSFSAMDAFVHQSRVFYVNQASDLDYVVRGTHTECGPGSRTRESMFNTEKTVASLLTLLYNKARH